VRFTVRILCRVATPIEAAGGPRVEARLLHGDGRRVPIWGFAGGVRSGSGGARGMPRWGRLGCRDQATEERAGGAPGQVGRHAAAARSQVSGFRHDMLVYLSLFDRDFSFCTDLVVLSKFTLWFTGLPLGPGDPGNW
jgi:hypothetical protein